MLKRGQGKQVYWEDKDLLSSMCSETEGVHFIQVVKLYYVIENLGFL